MGKFPFVIKYSDRYNNYPRLLVNTLVSTKQNKRGRPSIFDRDEAVATARRLFHEKGYDGVGVAELGKAMGIKPPSLYAAFGSKRELYELALDEYIASCGQWIAETLRRDGPVDDCVAALFDEAATRYTDSNNAPGCMVMNGSRWCSDDTVTDLTRRRTSSTRDLVRQRLSDAEVADVDMLSDYIMLVLQGLSAGAAGGWSRQAVRSAAESASAAFARLLGQGDR